MDKRRLFLSFTAVYMAACLYYRQALSLLPVILLPIAVHELSHIFALKLLKQKICGIALEAYGLCIYYRGACSAADHILAALAGPMGGILYALLGFTGIAWIEQSAKLSLLFTAFNLLPLLPLDGGRVFLQLCILWLGEEPGIKLCRATGSVLLSVLLFGGVMLALWKKSTAPLAASIWLLLFQNEEEGLVKRGEII